MRIYYKQWSCRVAYRGLYRWSPQEGEGGEPWSTALSSVAAQVAARLHISHRYPVSVTGISACRLSTIPAQRALSVSSFRVPVRDAHALHSIGRSAGLLDFYSDSRFPLYYPFQRTRASGIAQLLFSSIYAPPRWLSCLSDASTYTCSWHQRFSASSLLLQPLSLFLRTGRSLSGRWGRGSALFSHQIAQLLAMGAVHGHLLARSCLMRECRAVIVKHVLSPFYDSAATVHSLSVSWVRRGTDRG